MIADPYKVLGVSRDATQDEIKSAYRSMAKKYHPDLHPDDPKAADRMNEINEAYDILSHPEKHRNYGNNGGYSGGYNGGNGGYSSYYGGSKNGYTSNNGTNGGYSDPFESFFGSNGQNQSRYGWYGDFNDFYKFFGNFSSAFNGYQQNSGYGNINPSEELYDRPVIKAVINAINRGEYKEAMMSLTTVDRAYRDARWHYLYALASYGNRDVKLAAEYMRMAVSLEPQNTLYGELLDKFTGESNTSRYGSPYSAGKTYVVRSPLRIVGRVIFYILIIRIILKILLWLSYGFFAPF